MTAAAAGNLRGNGVTLASSSTHPAVIPTVIRACAASSAATIHSQAAADSSAYGPQRLIGGTYLRNRKFPGNGMRNGPRGSRVTPYTSKRLEVYGVTRLPLGPFRIPFPGNFLFLKYVPPIKRWGPYAELSAAAWEWIVAALEAAHARMTVGITAGWVEDDASVTPFPRKFPAAAAVIRAAAARGVLEVANHGYTHCVLDNDMFRPRLFHGNRPFHREFYDWLPETVHREHVTRAQGILQDYL